MGNLPARSIRPGRCESGWQLQQRGGRRSEGAWDAPGRGADDLLFIDVGRGSETGALGRAAPRFCGTIPLQSCQQNTIRSWQSLRVPWLYEHVDMPQKQLLLRAWNAAHFSNTDTAEVYLSVPWWLWFFFLQWKTEIMPCILYSKNSLLSLF